MKLMLDLIVLALETDTTRVAAYQLCAEDGVGICDRFPTILGIGRRGHHQLQKGPAAQAAMIDSHARAAATIIEVMPVSTLM